MFWIVLWQRQTELGHIQQQNPSLIKQSAFLEHFERHMTVRKQVMTYKNQWIVFVNHLFGTKCSNEPIHINESVPPPLCLRLEAAPRSYVYIAVARQFVNQQWVVVQHINPILINPISQYLPHLRWVTLLYTFRVVHKVWR